MQQLFADLPREIENSISELLKREDNSLWFSAAENIHKRYSTRDKGKAVTYLNDYSDALAYLALRFPATYAQIYGTCLAVQEVLPIWTPKTLLDLGSGPGTGVFAAQKIWPNLMTAKCLDVNDDLIGIGKKILNDSQVPTKVLWEQKDLQSGINENDKYDIVLIANVLNEVNKSDAEKLIEKAYSLCSGVMIVIDPGTAFGNELIQLVASKMSKSGYLIAPYINNSFVESNEYWLHFPQRFKRPEFQRSIRQHMRESALMASDWEEAKYSYVAISRFPSVNNHWARLIGPVKIQKGFLEAPILTREKVSHVKIMKRNKKEYIFAKNLKWGELISHEDDVKSAGAREDLIVS